MHLLKFTECEYATKIVSTDPLRSTQITERSTNFSKSIFDLIFLYFEPNVQFWSHKILRLS